MMDSIALWHIPCGWAFVYKTFSIGIAAPEVVEKARFMFIFIGIETPIDTQDVAQAMHFQALTRACSSVSRATI